MTQLVNLYLVGGAVRDKIRGVESKDFDFAVEAPSYELMRQWITGHGFEIFVDSPKYFTIRARIPAGFSWKFADMELQGQTFDFTLCRKERGYSDGRHPDVVEVGTIYDDLARRDFTMNAIALSASGEFIDPFGGITDIENKWICCVGTSPWDMEQRLEEDGLRVLRALRFSIQLGFNIDGIIESFIHRDASKVLNKISDDRIRDELGKMFKIDPYNSIHILGYYDSVANHVFEYRGLWLIPTTAKK